ncbi:hypothetical protein NPIL_133451 [Nephila pilipes]|uniref:Uncharacterized protein n=1 Tax=Nephila pilipes TaxID=299642 RepID=A0A8X6MXA9_NEPPI|nr:hypothetical protein NPIL_133451 [Nephila pilipes]
MKVSLPYRARRRIQAWMQLLSGVIRQVLVIQVVGKDLRRLQADRLTKRGSLVNVEKGDMEECPDASDKGRNDNFRGHWVLSDKGGK